jgi:superfamily II DNA/RNA helicase
MKFISLNLAAKIQQAIDACGYKDMTPVQEQSMSLARKGRDLLVNAQTGTGKTAAFALPILQRMLDKPNSNTFGHPRALILTPTRELAEQLATTIAAYAQFLDFRITATYGGVKMGGQTNKLKAGIDILISTPGRLLEHVNLGHVNLAAVEFLVLDEADRMLDMGFINDVSSLIQQTSDKRQTLLYSATMTPALNELSHQVLRNHKEIRASKVNTTAETVEHVIYPVEEARKIDLFMDLLQEYNWFQVLVFTSTKRQADKLLEILKKQKVKAALCHGDKSQGSRRRALADFKSAKLQVLVATEIAARGLDIVGLDFVVNYNLPFLAEDYVHRIGRTGRAGNSGQAISFVSREEEQAVNRIERIIGGKIKRIFRRGYEVSERSRLIKNITKKPKTYRTNKSGTEQLNKKGIKPKKKRVSHSRTKGKKPNSKKK